MGSKATGTYLSTVAGGETVNAFVPDPLPPSISPEAMKALAEPLSAAEAALDRLCIAGEMIPSLNWFVYSFVRKEALLSSEIEGTQATLTDVFSFERIGRRGGSDQADVEEVTNYIRAVDYAMKEIGSDDGLPISVRLLNECHRRLMQGVRGKDKQPGEHRRSQVWIGGTRPGNAVFVPPPADKVSELLADLETYIHAESELPPLLRIAAIHLQFESIHPYLDGNGRLGRMIITLLFSHWRLLDTPSLYLSLYLKRHQATYYDLLNQVREQGAWAEWFRFFLDGVASVADDAVVTSKALHKQIDDDRVRLLSTDPVTVSAIRLFELLPANPVLTMPVATDLLETTKPTASKAIEVLKNAGILEQIDDRKRDRLYKYGSYIDLIS